MTSRSRQVTGSLRIKAAKPRIINGSAAQSNVETLADTAMVVREAEAQKQIKEEGVVAPRPEPGSQVGPTPQPGNPGPVVGPVAPGKPRRFYRSVEIDMIRPVKSFDAILNAVVMELQHTHGAKVKLTLEIEAEANEGFADSEVGLFATMRGS